MGVGCMKEARCSITSFLSDGFERDGVGGGSGGRAFSSEGRTRNADRRSEELDYSTCVSPSCPRLGWEGICQVKTAANDFGGAWNTDKESQVLRMRADLDSSNRVALLRVQETQPRHLPQISFHYTFFLSIFPTIMRGKYTEIGETSWRNSPKYYLFTQYSSHPCKSHSSSSSKAAVFTLRFVKKKKSIQIALPLCQQLSSKCFLMSPDEKLQVLSCYIAVHV